VSFAEITSWAASAATVIAAIAVVATAVIYQRQLQAMTKARQLESLVVIMKYSEDLKLRKAGYFMFEHAQQLRELFDVPFSWEVRKAIDERLRQLSADEFGILDVDRSLDALNNMCYLIRRGYAPAEAVDAVLRNPVLHAWHVFGPYIHHRRNRPDAIGEPSHFGEHLEWVVQSVCRVARAASR
jgi:hypothetical protein